MKYIYSLIIIALFAVSCSGGKKKSVEKVIESGNLETIRAKRVELVSEQQVINDKIKLLDEKIKSLDTTKNVPLVTSIKVNTEVFEHVLELQGNVTTKDLLTVTPEFNGILTKVYVKEGQSVRKGQILAKIDDGGLSQQLAQLKIQAELAKTTYERQKRLWEQNIGSEIQFLQAQSNYQAQQESVNQLNKQIAKTTVIAPFSGTIDDIITEQGSVVAAGQTPLMRIVNLDNMYIETEVPERYVSDVTKGKSVSVNIPVLGKIIETKIRQAGDFINPANRTFKVEVEIPNDDKSIKPNLTARLKINDYTNENAILIPQSVVSENSEGEQYVYIVTDKSDKNIGTAKRVIIKTGKTQDDIIEVLKGLETGAEIIQEGARSVKDGQSVEVLKMEETK
ncbi:RND family efflux transporter MFP subunit [Winogradskyella epiphytica]|uniref:RND family efflux transporter MFP subunit n=1 Tax=Winogradskyella epiphytica TaxID=262005 RepID=A0A2V4XBX5_9FLAO|nr:efflux RND transporter periplasmic adaptor subunit [Winogradskyella epiphytica]PYE83535.1 RND family efflux transporter MFP subunit [Winogradskyella epiphytica]GGW58870.1 RND transporter [Winogradskyella epiphytica]